MSINTRKATGRRELRFNSLDDVLADLNQLQGRPLRTLGNWSVGQILVHLTVPMNGAIEGFKLPIPWYLRLAAKIFRHRFLNGKMPAGFKLPAVAEKVMVPGPVSAEDGFNAIRRAIARLQSDPHREIHPLFGPLTIDEYNKITCRHCELHLSFIVIKP